jgi:hypothetical protein
MQLGWIYAFRDRGFDRGVKIGLAKNHRDRFKVAQCYTPRGIDLVALWPIHDQRFSTLKAAEDKAQERLPNVGGENTGQEWFDVTAQEAVDRVSRNLEVSPESVVGNPRISTTYDDFRHPKRLAQEPDRQILWIYSENVTSILKVQRTSLWKVPREAIKTYSLLGFRPVGAFGNFSEPNVRDGNCQIHDLWIDLVNEHGNGVNHFQVGWLRPEAKLERLKKIALARGLTEITDWSRCPPGLLSGYTKSR